MHRRQFLQAALMGAAATSCAKPSRTPNIIFVMLDDLGYGDFGCYGQKLIRTPRTDAFAKQGVRFTDVYAGSTVCAPSRCVLMTGKHTGHSSIRSNAGTMPLLASDRTVASSLKEAGYATGAFGKWGLGDIRTEGVPWKHGFDEFYGYLHQVHAHSYYPDFVWDNDRQVKLEGNAEGKGTQHTADLVAEKTFDFVRRNRNQPFFCYACWTMPHGRYEIPSQAPYENEDWTGVEKTYAAMVTKADEHFGKLLDLLDELQLAENTVVFLTSDNGGVDPANTGLARFQSNGPLRGSKGNLYEGGIRVPMIARWPGVASAGTERSEPWSFQDLHPTACELAGLPTPSDLDGKSVAPLLRGEAVHPERPLYWEFYNFDMKAQEYRLDRMQRAVRKGKWKLVRPSPEAPLELYDLSTDVGEQRNLADTESAVAKDLDVWMSAQHTPPRAHEGALSLQFARE
ncbi:MAG: arylsulfatase [Bryobacterales bacterium]|nr:arylsulfatase [Bryobacterales bacterium]